MEEIVVHRTPAPAGLNVNTPVSMQRRLMRKTRGGTIIGAKTSPSRAGADLQATTFCARKAKSPCDSHKFNATDPGQTAHLDGRFGPETERHSVLSLDIPGRSPTELGGRGTAVQWAGRRAD
jgi:hypothetical protein